MNDRDRLAADLDEWLSAADDEWTVGEAADFLIALGWTRCAHVGVEEVVAQAQARIATLDARVVALNAEVLDRMDQWHRDSLARDELARQQNREIARLRNLVNTLDEDRLARALADLFPAVQRDRWPFTTEQAAAAIAKVYREDT